MCHVILTTPLSGNIFHRQAGTCVRLSGGSRAVAAATVAAAGGCREEVEVDDGGDGDCASCCCDAAAIPVARLSDIWPPLGPMHASIRRAC